MEAGQVDARCQLTLNDFCRVEVKQGVAVRASSDVFALMLILPCRGIGFIVSFTVVHHVSSVEVVDAKGTRDVRGDIIYEAINIAF